MQLDSQQPELIQAQTTGGARETSGQHQTTTTATTRRELEDVQQNQQQHEQAATCYARVINQQQQPAAQVGTPGDPKVAHIQHALDSELAGQLVEAIVESVTANSELQLELADDDRRHQAEAPATLSENERKAPLRSKLAESPQHQNQQKTGGRIKVTLTSAPSQNSSDRRQDSITGPQQAIHIFDKSSCRSSTTAALAKRQSTATLISATGDSVHSGSQRELISSSLSFSHSINATEASPQTSGPFIGISRKDQEVELRRIASQRKKTPSASSSSGQPAAAPSVLAPAATTASTALINKHTEPANRPKQSINQTGPNLVETRKAEQQHTLLSPQQQQQAFNPKQLAIYINGKIRSNSIFCHSTSSYSSKSILNKFHPSTSNSTKEQQAVRKPQGPPESKFQAPGIYLDDKELPLTRRHNKRTGSKKDPRSEKLYKNLVSNLCSNAQRILPKHKLLQSFGVNLAKESTSNRSASLTGQHVVADCCSLIGSANSKSIKSAHTDAERSSFETEIKSRFDAKIQSFDSNKDLPIIKETYNFSNNSPDSHSDNNQNNGDERSEKQQQQPPTASYKLNPSSMFLRKAMRYYRLWIYGANITIFLGTLIFFLAAIYVASDYRIKLLVRSGDQHANYYPFAIQSARAAQSQSNSGSNNNNNNGSLNGETTSSPQQQPSDTANDLQGHSHRVYHNDDIHISYSEPSVLLAYLAIAIQAGILQAIGCFGAIRMKEKWIQTFWYLILALTVCDVMFLLYWLHRYDFIMKSIRHHMTVRLTQEYGLGENHFIGSLNESTNAIYQSTLPLSSNSSNRQNDQLVEGLPQELHYKLDKILTEIIDKIQVESQCCGISGPRDYKHSRWRQLKQEHLGQKLGWLQAQQQQNVGPEQSQKLILLNVVPFVPASCCRRNFADTRPTSGPNGKPVILDDSQLVKPARFPAWSPSMVVDNLHSGNLFVQRGKAKTTLDEPTSEAAGNKKLNHQETVTELTLADIIDRRWTGAGIRDVPSYDNGDVSRDLDRDQHQAPIASDETNSLGQLNNNDVADGEDLASMSNARRRLLAKQKNFNQPTTTTPAPLAMTTPPMQEDMEYYRQLSIIEDNGANTSPRWRRFSEQENYEDDRDGDNHIENVDDEGDKDYSEPSSVRLRRGIVESMVDNEEHVLSRLVEAEEEASGNDDNDGNSIKYGPAVVESSPLWMDQRNEGDKIEASGAWDLNLAKFGNNMGVTNGGGAVDTKRARYHNTASKFAHSTQQLAGINGGINNNPPKDSKRGSLTEDDHRSPRPDSALSSAANKLTNTQSKLDSLRRMLFVQEDSISRRHRDELPPSTAALFLTSGSDLVAAPDHFRWPNELQLNYQQYKIIESYLLGELATLSDAISASREAGVWWSTKNSTEAGLFETSNGRSSATASQPLDSVSLMKYTNSGGHGDGIPVGGQANNGISLNNISDKIDYNRTRAIISGYVHRATHSPTLCGNVEELPVSGSSEGNSHGLTTTAHAATMAASYGGETGLDHRGPEQIDGHKLARQENLARAGEGWKSETISISGRQMQNSEALGDNRRQRRHLEDGASATLQTGNGNEKDMAALMEKRRLLLDELRKAIHNDSELSCAARSYYDQATIYTQGCHLVIKNWLDTSWNILFVTGLCVLTVLKICSVVLLRLEIREMIHKIKVLKGMATEYNALHDLEAYLPRPSVCAQAAELTPSGVAAAIPTSATGLPSVVSGTGGPSNPMVCPRLGGSFSEAVAAATAQAAAANPCGQLGTRSLTSNDRAASMKAVAAMSSMLTPGMCPRSSSVSTAHLHAASGSALLGHQQALSLRSDLFPTSMPRRHTAVSVCPAAAAAVAETAAQHLMSRRGTYVANPIFMPAASITSGSQIGNCIGLGALAQHRHSAHTVHTLASLNCNNQLQHLLSANQGSQQQTNASQLSPTSRQQRQQQLLDSSRGPIEHQSSGESNQLNSVTGNDTTTNRSSGGSHQLLSLMYPFKRQSSSGGRSAGNFSLDLSPSQLTESRRSIH